MMTSSSTGAASLPGMYIYVCVTETCTVLSCGHVRMVSLIGCLTFGAWRERDLFCGGRLAVFSIPQLCVPEISGIPEP